MSVTVRITESPPHGPAARATGTWMPWGWVAFLGATLIATGEPRLTREEVLSDIRALTGGDVVLQESRWPMWDA